MTRTLRAEALFASDLQPSDRPAAAAVAAAVQRSLLSCGGATGCAAAVAAEFGEHPETAVARMRWALTVVDTLTPAAPAELVAA